MGEAQGTLFEPEFNRSVKVETSQQRITSHAGAVLLRELDHKLGLVESLASQLVDPRAIPIGFAIRPSNCCGSGCTHSRWARRTRTTWTAWPTTRLYEWPPGTDRAKAFSKND